MEQPGGSRPAFALYGLDVLPDGCVAEGETQPHAGQACWSGAMGYHNRAGWHDVRREDWEFYFQYMDEYLKA